MAKELTGTVVSTKMAQTAVVSVLRKVRHPLYRKTMSRTKRYKAHINVVTAAMGDTVVIREVRPISKDTHFLVVANTTALAKK